MNFDLRRFSYSVVLLRQKKTRFIVHSTIKSAIHSIHLNNVEHGICADKIRA